MFLALPAFRVAGVFLLVWGVWVYLVGTVVRFLSQWCGYTRRNHSFAHAKGWIIIFFIIKYLIHYTFFFKVASKTTRYTDFLCKKPLWAIYVAHFAMNWSSYIIMQWLPTYLSRSLGANAKSISLTAVPYVVNSLVGIGKCFVFIYF